MQFYLNSMFYWVAVTRLVKNNTIYLLSLAECVARNTAIGTMSCRDAIAVLTKFELKI